MYYDELLFDADLLEESTVNSFNGNGNGNGNRDGNDTVVNFMKPSNFYKVKRHFDSTYDDEYYRYITVKYYTSGDVNSRIIDACSGHPTIFRVGTEEEELFFKVSICNGEVRRQNTKNTPVTLFYLSPEEYEREHYVKLSDTSKEKWRKRYELAEKRYNLKLEALGKKNFNNVLLEKKINKKNDNSVKGVKELWQLQYLSAMNENIQNTEEIEKLDVGVVVVK